MRIISQNGEINLSLDVVHLSTFISADGTFGIHARDHLWERPITLGTYSTAEKCKAVFDTICMACSKEMNVIRLPQEEEV